MGCELTKMIKSEPHDLMNQPPPPSDPRCPLTTKQQYCMLASWKGIFRQIEKTGVLLFIKLFEENEDLLHLFEKFQELRTTEDLSQSEELAEHANKVMHTLDEGIKGLGDIDTFLAYIQHVGATHHQVPGFKAENFWKIEQPFLQAAKTTLGERYTANVENIYKLTIKFILENLVKGYEDSAGKEIGNNETT
ncbi:neuroglobin-like [Bombyx mandarina]|uniref:Globin domain-containing protein n=2 Tax=Bombyx TaxID=7090 RepID=A0A8R2M3G2_BOMMO|nr:neuroglobin [Bombyx mori]XP_021204085.1 neuroglobin [Bombyx mori]XP_028028962.1 neuroglobin-like [Bombyx mandarina]XP_037873292.1 neuroglobin [Bombyx mori]